ncbi:MAG: caspase family protein [Pseudorhodoplanes sp.]|uniref:caspase family protein n=1 Tax=Pseudorhodoplanes sp. TaxID=1934341 RepID=UPI003D0D8921
MRRHILALATLLLCCAPHHDALAAKRIALVIGNNAYSEVPKLEKAVGDAQAISATLQGLGFDVIAVLDANRSRMARALVDLETRVSPGDTVLFFFAGHGVALDGGNYLMPVDVPDVTEGQRNLLRTEGFLADDISERLRERGAATTVMILDACRNNPFKAGPGRSIGQSRGLSRMDARRGMFVMFSAGAGQEALDRLGDSDTHPNSVFTRLFIDLVKRPDLDLIDVAKELQIEVPKLAASVGHEQLPAYYDQIPGRIFLARTDRSSPPPIPPRPQRVQPSSPPPAAVAPPAAPSPPPVAALPRETYRVLGNVSQGIHNMRSGPGTNFPLVVSIPAGSTGLVIGRCRPPQDGRSAHRWCEVTWRGHRGWTSSCCVVSQQTGSFPR